MFVFLSLFNDAASTAYLTTNERSRWLWLES